MKDQHKTAEKEQNGYKQSISYRIQNTAYRDAQWTQWEPQQHKKDSVRFEGFTNLNEE